MDPAGSRPLAVGEQVKQAGRLEGTRHPVTGEPSCILRVLRFTPVQLAQISRRGQPRPLNEVTLQDIEEIPGWATQMGNRNPSTHTDREEAFEGFA